MREQRQAEQQAALPPPTPQLPPLIEVEVVPVRVEPTEIKAGPKPRSGRAWLWWTLGVLGAVLFLRLMAAMGDAARVPPIMTPTPSTAYQVRMCEDALARRRSAETVRAVQGASSYRANQMLDEANLDIKRYCSP
ncbi:MAG: hypothetical protein U0821_18835 [Chloroflexota bacterium]